MSRVEASPPPRRLLDPLPALPVLPAGLAPAEEESFRYEKSFEDDVRAGPPEDDAEPGLDTILLGAS